MMQVHQGARLILTVAIAAISWSTSTPSFAQVEPQVAAVPLNSKNSATVISAVEPALQDYVDKQKRLPSQSKQVLVKVSIDDQNGDIWIDLDSGYLPKDTAGQLEEFRSMVADVEEHATDLLVGVVELHVMRTRIGGKTMSQIFPPDHQKER
jgi:hypothetical protein